MCFVRQARRVSMFIASALDLPEKRRGESKVSGRTDVVVRVQEAFTVEERNSDFAVFEFIGYITKHIQK